MNIEALKANLRELSKKVYALRYADNAISDEELRARIARITEVREKANIHAAWSRHRLKRKYQLKQFYSIVRRVKKELADKTFMCFDIENNFAEFGISIFKNGEHQTFNIRVVDFEHFDDAKEFLHGQTMYLAFDDAVSMLKSYAEMSDFYVGHSVRNDFDVLKSRKIDMPVREFFDTCWMANMLDGDDPRRLGSLCVEYGIVFGNAHVGGNDARANMEVFLAMVSAHA